MVYNGYYKVMSNIPNMGQLPTPDFFWIGLWPTAERIGQGDLDEVVAATRASGADDIGMLE